MKTSVHKKEELKNNSAQRIPKWIKSLKFSRFLLIAVLFSPTLLIGQPEVKQSEPKESIAVINIDAQGLSIKMPLVTSLATLELEKLDLYEVIDKFDVSITMKKNSLDVSIPYGKTQLIQIGTLLNVDKILSGSVEKYGSKIIVILRLIDVKSKSIIKSDVMEYIDQEENIQEMMRISIRNIVGLENDKNFVDMLSNFNPPLVNGKSKINLSGPRFGGTMTFGTTGERMQAPKNVGGFNMYPVSSTFGYQHEVQFISAGDFQALFEVIGSLNALESGNFIPSVTVLNGFRFNKIGIEFGIGPVFRVAKLANGYYDASGQWTLKSDTDIPGIVYINQLDSRGNPTLSTGLIIAAGYTFKSGYINFPINIYVSPRKEGTVVGLLFGFNVANSKKKF